MHYLYAPPLGVWSKWYRLLPLTIPAKITIKAEPAILRGSSEFQIEVRYFDENSQRQFRDFSVLRKITFNAGRLDYRQPDAQEIAVRLKGSLSGQNIRVWVDWAPR